MKPAQFDYQRPETLEEVLSLLDRHGEEAKVLAGGQSLVPAMNFRLAQPAVLIDLNSIESLSALSQAGDSLRCGAMLRQRSAETSSAVATSVPLLARSLPFVAHPQIRNRGTVGGSLAHADPASELPAVAVALGAKFHLRSSERERTLASDEFFVDLLTTALEPNELLTAIDFPVQGPGFGTAFAEVSRRHGDYALVGVAASVQLVSGVCRSVRVALLSVGPGPMFAAACEAALLGEEPSKERIRAAAAAAAAEDIEPASDIQASADYRRHLARVLIERVLTQSFKEAAGTAP